VGKWIPYKFNLEPTVKNVSTGAAGLVDNDVLTLKLILKRLDNGISNELPNITDISLFIDTSLVEVIYEKGDVKANISGVNLILVFVFNGFI
jgi:hypothetical protein